MTPNGPPPLSVDLAVYTENRRHFPEAALRPYAGQYVAFNADASRIVASAPELGALFANLRTAGIALDQVVWEWAPGPDEEGWL